MTDGLKVMQVAVLMAIASWTLAYPAIQKPLDSLQSLGASKSGRSRPLPDMRSTIDEVQQILLKDPTLPRLTRGEIEELFEQVAKEEYSKSMETGDVSRANSMRALMLVLPYNTNNTTEENLQELYTRPPITKVIDSYSAPQPHKLSTTPASTIGKVEIIEVGNLAATTYKPSFRLKQKINLNPTTYHPLQTGFKPIPPTTEEAPVQALALSAVTPLPLLPDIEDEQAKVTRYSSSYSAKDTDWSLLEGELNHRNAIKKFTPMPDISEMFQAMNMDAQAAKRFKVEDYYSVPKPAISSAIKQMNGYSGTIDIADFTRTLPPRLNLEAYYEFKPLNIGEEIRIKPDLEPYLNRFGLVNRKRKQIKPEDSDGPSKAEDSSSNPSSKTSASTSGSPTPEVATPTMNSAQTESVPNKALEQPIKRIDTNINDSDATNTQDQEDLVQLTKLLNNLQELERLNVSLTADMLKAAELGNFNLSSSIRSQGPDPILNTADTQKNDLKRQSATESPSDPTRFNLDVDLPSTDSDLLTSSTTTSTTEEPSSTTEESRNGSLADLEDSFGGPDPVTEDPSPPPKQNGFYFLADWNSFLEVGEAGKDQVVVRFDPKIGDARRFLQVTVP